MRDVRPCLTRSHIKRGGHVGHSHTWTILCNGRCYVRSISARCSTGLFRVEVNRSAVPTVRRASRSTCDNSAQTHYSRPEVLWLPSHLYRKATLTPTHTRETHTRTHTHTSQTPLFSLLTANLSKRSAVGGGGKRTKGSTHTHTHTNTHTHQKPMMYYLTERPSCGT